MIIVENKAMNGKEFKHTYSNSGMKIKRENVLYDEAYDPIEFSEERIYEETDIVIGEDIEDV